MDGAAVIRLVAEAYGWTLNEPGYEERIETLSLARWGGVRTFDFLVQQGFSPVQLRGTILIDQSLLGDTMAKTLDIVRTRILELQKG
jgi:hypothetical protein